MSETTKEAKANRPWFKKKRFWVLGIIALIAIPIMVMAVILVMATVIVDGGEVSDGGAAGSSQESAAMEEAPVVVTAEQMLSDLDANALAASNTYKGKRVTVTGTLSNIDASGNYFTLTGSPDDFAITPVLINIDESQRDTVMAFTSDQEVTVTGMVTDVGEVMGYAIGAETIG